MAPLAFASSIALQFGSSSLASLMRRMDNPTCPLPAPKSLSSSVVDSADVGWKTVAAPKPLMICWLPDRSMVVEGGGGGGGGGVPDDFDLLQSRKMEPERQIRSETGNAMRKTFINQG